MISIPRSARRAKLEGRVVVEVAVGTGGGSRDVCLRSVTREHVGFEQAAFMFIEEEWVPPTDKTGHYVVEVDFALEPEPRDDAGDSPSN